MQIDKSHPIHPRNEDAKKKKLQVRLRRPRWGWPSEILPALRAYELRVLQAVVPVEPQRPGKDKSPVAPANGKAAKEGKAEGKADAKDAKKDAGAATSK